MCYMKTCIAGLELAGAGQLSKTRFNMEQQLPRWQVTARHNQLNIKLYLV